jgi:tetratricopeptide (TPR) repeat protein
MPAWPLVCGLLSLLALSPALAEERDHAPPAPAAAIEPPAPVDAVQTPEHRKKALDALYVRLAKATDDVEATGIRADIRQLWRQSGSATIDLLLDRDAQAALVGEPRVRRQLLEAAAKLAPEATEVWNRRAGLDFSEQRVSEAVADLGHVLALDPKHFDALEALSGILRDTGRDKLALLALRQLKAINPTAPNLQTQIDELARKVEGQPI